VIAADCYTRGNVDGSTLELDGQIVGRIFPITRHESERTTLDNTGCSAQAPESALESDGRSVDATPDLYLNPACGGSFDLLSATVRPAMNVKIDTKDPAGV
jgi:hypothetical protein